MFDRIAKFVLYKTGQKLHLPTMELYLALTQTIDGKVVHDTGLRRARSWNRNAYNNVFTVIAGVNRDGTGFGAGSLAFKNVSGATVGGNMAVVSGGGAAIGVTTYGILLGSNNAAESFEGYKIGTLIPNGMGTGQVNYGDSYYSGAFASGTFTVTLKRYFNNNSGSNIDVGEVALYPNSTYMFCREAYDPKVSFLDKAQLRVLYQFILAYPS